LLKFEEIRDIGLLGMAIYMIIVGNDAFAIDGLWGKSNRNE